MIKIVFKEEARKKLKKINPKDQLKTLTKIEQLEKSPLEGKLLKGKLNGYRSLRAWPLRIIYIYNQKNKIITIVTIDYREGVYK